MRLVLPRLYVILDAALLTLPETQLAASLAEAGVRLLQYRNKQASARELLEKSRPLAEELLPRQVHFIVNDRADVAALAGAGGVHVGQDDLGATAARGIVGLRLSSAFPRIISSNSLQPRKLLRIILRLDRSLRLILKANPTPSVGLEMIRAGAALDEQADRSYRWNYPGARGPK